MKKKSPIYHPGELLAMHYAPGVLPIIVREIRYEARAQFRELLEEGQSESDAELTAFENVFDEYSDKYPEIPNQVLAVILHRFREV